MLGREEYLVNYLERTR